MLLDWWRSTPSRKEAPALWRVTRGDKLALFGSLILIASGTSLLLVLFAYCVNTPGTTMICQVYRLAPVAFVLAPYLPAGALIVWSLIRSSRVVHTAHKIEGIACPGCLYDLRAIATGTERCPECSCDLRRWPVPDSWPREVGGGKRKP